MEKSNSLSTVDNKRNSVADKLLSITHQLNDCTERLVNFVDKLSLQEKLDRELETVAQLIGKFYATSCEFRRIAFVRDIGEIGEAEGTLVDQIWFERHKCLEYEIEQGTESCDPAIWAQAKLRAKEMEAKYGNDILVKSDFEWGMRNGKLSAIRWMLGDEWDELDT